MFSNLCISPLLSSAIGRHIKHVAPTCSLLSKKRHFSDKRHPLVAETLDAGTCLELKVSRWPHHLGLSYVWLRDHCRCPQCYNYRTFQRAFDVHQIPLNIRPANVKATQEGVEIKWPDGHQSHYDYKFLWQNSYEGQRTSRKESRITWKAATFPKSSLISVPLNDVRQTDGLKRLISSIATYGLAFISEVPPDPESTREAVELVAEIRKTFFGDFYVFEAHNMEHLDTAYTKDFLGAHTDTTYFSQASRIQIFHCLQAASHGGETLLVDGFNIADQYKYHHPEGFSYLSNMAIPSEYMEDGERHISLDTIFKLNPVTGRMQQFRYNLYDRAPLSSIPLERQQEFYLHLRNLTNIVRNPRNEYWLQLKPGNMIFIDNWRVMHGRNNFEGKRVMSGCYIGNEEFTSKARVLGVQVD